jgi:hypothetical protein
VVAALGEAASALATLLANEVAQKAIVMPANFSLRPFIAEIAFSVAAMAGPCAMRCISPKSFRAGIVATELHCRQWRSATPATSPASAMIRIRPGFSR